MSLSGNTALLLLSTFALTLISPIPVRGWSLAGDVLQEQPLAGSTESIPYVTQSDLDQDSQPEYLLLSNSKLAIKRGAATLWQSPDTWEVTQARLADLNRDGLLEAALLVWRPFKPWPIDRYIPHPGRIDSFHDAQGRSCQIVLIGGSHGSYHEVWAGSALAEPVSDFTAADLNGDRFPELVTLDRRYEDTPSARSRSLSIWEWNGFGFSLLDRTEGRFTSVRVVQIPGESAILLIVGE
ncbi:MAG: hypothetical protein M1281_12240 [Chloroflexi bacterium]|nr:hypothetical protein [Chloroflexota bacterium]